mgnify:CR=1 FL=1
MAVILSGGAVVGFGGLEFVMEGAEKYGLAFDSDLCLPEVMLAVPSDTLVLRAVGSVFVFGAVSDILGVGCRTEVCLAVIEAVAVDMVNKHIVRDIYYPAVHGNLTLFSGFGSYGSGGVEGSAYFDCTPFVFADAAVVVRVNNGVFSLGQWYSAEGVSIADAAIQKHRKN